MFCLIKVLVTTDSKKIKVWVSFLVSGLQGLKIPLAGAYEDRSYSSYEWPAPSNRKQRFHCSIAAPRKGPARKNHGGVQVEISNVYLFNHYL